MQRVLFFMLSILVVGSFGGLFSSSNDNDQLTHRHQRQQPQKIQQCVCQQQTQYFNELKQTYAQCQQQCQQQAPIDTQQQIQQTRDCYSHHTRQMQQSLDCIDNKLQQQQQQQRSCAQQQQQSEQIQNEDANARFADNFERTADNIRQQIEEAYEQQQPTENNQQNQQNQQQNQQIQQNQQNNQQTQQNQQQNQNQQGQQQQKFGKAFGNQVVDCTNRCFVQKVRQQDNSQNRGCEFRFESEQLKQALGECQQKHTKLAVENVCQCATAKGQQGAEEFCQNIKEKKFEAEQLFKQY